MYVAVTVGVTNVKFTSCGQQVRKHIGVDIIQNPPLLLFCVWNKNMVVLKIDIWEE